MSALTFVTGLPPRGHAGNGSHGHWTKKAAARKGYRQEVWADAIAVGCPAPLARARVHLLFGIKGGRATGRYQPRDISNAIAAFKAGFDALKDARLIVDDSRTHLVLGRVEITADDGPWVRVTLEGLE